MNVCDSYAVYRFFSHELHSPGVYTELDAYFEKHKSTDLDLQEERKSLKHSPLPDLPVRCFLYIRTHVVYLCMIL